MYFVENENELQHHGIRGQKWGVRRFQNADGTLTPRGKVRYDGADEESGDGSKSGGSRINKGAVMKGAAIAGAVALGAVLITNPGARNVLGKYGKTAVTSLGTAAGKGAAKFMNKASARMDKVGDAMFDAVLLSVGGIAISKVTEKFAVGDDASESDKIKSKVMTDVATSAIKAATSAGGSSNSGSSNGNKTGGSMGAEKSEAITAKVGPPSKKGVNKQSPEWQNLFKGADEQTRQDIKNMASAGWDIDQINKYLGHSDFEDWASKYMGVEIGW